MNDNFEQGLTVGLIIGVLAMTILIWLCFTFDSTIRSGNGFVITNNIYKCQKYFDLEKDFKDK